MIKGFYKLILLFFGITIFFSCDTFKLETIETESQITLPGKVTIEIPSSLNAIEQTLNNKNLLSIDTIYNYIRIFINIADEAGKIAENSFDRLSAIETKDILEFSYTGNDGNTKNVSIRENFIENDVSWDYYMEIYNVTFADLALKAYWNSDNNEQKIVFNPSKVNVKEMLEHPDALVEIVYKQDIASEPYEKSMFMAIKGLTIPENDHFSPDNILLFIGQNGNTLDVTGSSNNPNVIFLNDEYSGGRNWSFVAKVDLVQNIAVAELALPPSWIETNENLPVNYSLKQILLDEMRLTFPETILMTDEQVLNMINLDPSEIENPVYFNNLGFAGTGIAPSTNYSSLINFEGQSFFVPIKVRDYNLEL